MNGAVALVESLHQRLPEVHDSNSGWQCMGYTHICSNLHFFFPSQQV
jgi:hypothetical protein